MTGALLAAALTWTAAYGPLHEAPAARVDSLLADSRWRALSAEEKLIALAPLRVGTPYALGCLGEETPPDEDPFFRLDRADCTVLILTDAALLHATSLADARSWIERIGYRGVPASYENRYHFTADRITASPDFQDLTPALLPDSLLREVHVVLNRAEGGAPLLPIPWERDLRIRYLPASSLDGSILARLPAACGVAFVSEANIPRGFLVSHEGLLLGHEILHHASSSAGRVVDVPLLKYIRRVDGAFRWDGLIFFNFRLDENN